MRGGEEARTGEARRNSGHFFKLISLFAYKFYPT
jgi:hypothetical protein